MRLSIILCIVLLGLFCGIWWFSQNGVEKPGAESTSASTKQVMAERSSAVAMDSADSAALLRERAGSGSLLIRGALNRLRAGGRPVPGQWTLRFRSPEAYQEFLQHSSSRGVEIIGTLERFHMAAVRVADWDRFAETLSGEEAEMAPNLLITVPGNPGVVLEPGALDSYQAVGAGLENWLNLPDTDASGSSEWTVAVLDTGISDHPTFMEDSLIRGTAPPAEQSNGHGTAVASLISGAHPQASGVAPGTRLLDVPVLGADGMGDSFSLASGIVQAVDAGADILNLSLSMAGESPDVAMAVQYALDQGVVVVAATGNDGSGRLPFPAAMEGVVAVGAVDATGVWLPFSNSGEGTSLTAPGLKVSAAWPENRVVKMTGTSASTPLVSGALARVLQAEPGLKPAEAADLLVQFADDAGAPGLDPFYGHGVLNVSRVLQRNGNGVLDAAVADHYLAPIEGRNLHQGLPGTAQVIVQNRGNETLFNLQLSTQIFTQQRSQYIPRLGPGEIFVKDLPISSVPGKELTLQSFIRMSQPDAIPQNNEKRSLVFEKDSDY